MNHDQIIELLPWYMNRTLDENERREVEAHLANCRECAKEVESLATMQIAVVEDGNRGPALSPFAFNRALAEIESYERTKASQGFRKAATKDQRRGWIQGWRLTPLFARALIAAQLGLLLALSAVALYQYTHRTLISQTASGASRDDKSSTRLVVRFSETATEHEIRQAVLAIKGSIVDGPSPQDLYTLQVPIAREQTEEIERALETLRQNQHVVLFAAQSQ